MNSQEADRLRRMILCYGEKLVWYNKKSLISLPTKEYLKELDQAGRDLTKASDDLNNFIDGMTE